MSIKNTNQLRSLLSGVIEKVIEGSVATNQANAVSNLVGKFMQTVQLDMKYHQMKENMPHIKFLDNSESDENNKLTHDPNTGEIK